MSSSLDKLVRMANQIAEEFEHQQGANAAWATWDHLRHFWDPDMRARIVAYLDAGGAGLRPACRDAVAGLRSGVEP
jgi:formate dehydrogenase subunit delta